MNKHAKRQLAASFVFLLFLLALTTSAVYAWLSNSLESTIGATSYVHKSYFESGDGTSTLQYNVSYDAQGNPTHGYDSQGNPLTSEAGCAFEIRYPLQLYYFAWLQNLGYFNTPDETTGVPKQVHFYLSADLDMSDYELPPIGTAQYPFLGTFDGNGHTITNLHIINDENELTDVPDSAEEDAINPQIVGFFGVVGEYGGSGIASDGVASVSDMILNGVNIETSAPTDGKSLIGIAAGYVNGEMSGVAVANSTVTVGSGVSALGVASSVSGGGTTNLSDYGLVGYCTEPYMLDLNVTKVSLAAPVETQNVIYKNLQNEGPGFGGSIKMETMYNRLLSVYNSDAQYAQYVSEEHWVVDEREGTSYHDTDRDVYSTNYSIKYYNEADQTYAPNDEDPHYSYSYTFSTYSTSTSATTSYMYLFGNDTVAYNQSYPNSTSITKTIYYEGLRHVNTTAYAISATADVARTGDAAGTTISYNNRYLNTNGSTISGGTSAYTATAWTVPASGGSGTVSTVINSTTYYLVLTPTSNNAGTLSVTSTQSQATTFTRATNGRLSASIRYNNNNRTYYVYNNNGNNGGTWSGSSNYRNLTYATAVSEATVYLNLNAAGNGLTTGYDAANATKWIFDGNNIYTEYNESAVYLYRSSTTALTVGNSASTTWTYSNSASTTIYNSVSNGYYGSTYYYITYNNGWAVSTTSKTLARTSSTYDGYINMTTTLTDQPSSFETPGTYYAINMDDAYSPNGNNTGYVVSGSTFWNTTASNSNERYPSKSGDIRVSQYAASNISTSTNGTDGWTQGTSGGNTYYTYTATADSRLEVITAVENGSYSGWYRVKDDVNKNNSSYSSTITGIINNNRRQDFKTLGLKRYEDARASMTETFVGSRYIYGLHFMNAAINKNNTIRIPKAYIEGEEYSDYPVPTDSIDFNVKRRGFITVFAGTYFDGNNAFFSLHRIFRDNNNEITDIKEISQIYKPADGDDFIYLYTDGTYSDGKSASDCGALAFDMAYMTNPGSYLVDNAVYYFEIPVNGGEFALGSVSGKTGAYLFYLDIAANGGQAEDKDRITISERFTEQVYDMTLPAGVQLIDANGAFDAQRPYETVTVALANGYNGAYTFTRTGNVFTYNAAANTELTYIGGALTASNGQGTAVNYYPNGYTVTTVENMTDTGRDTTLVDKTRIETVDTYDSSGTLVQPRTVKVYAGVDVTADPADFIEIVSFTYDSSTHANMKTRVVRAASSGGFNVVFDQEMALTATVTDTNVHVNFGNNTSNYMQTVVAADSPASLTLRSETVINMTNDEPEEVYYTAVIGPDIAAYYSYVEGGDGVERDTAPTLTTSPIAAGTTNATQSLNYAITLSSDSEIIVYATQLINTYGGTTYVENSGKTAAQSANFTVNTENTAAVVTVNGTALEKNLPKEIVIAAPQQSTP